MEIFIAMEYRTEDTKMNKRYQITVTGRGETVLFWCSETENLLEAMLRQDIYISAVCGGRGTCGKCKIQLLQGELTITEFDQKTFTQEELRDGYRLSCKAYPVSDCTIRVASRDEADFEVVAENVKTSGYQNDMEDRYAIGIDIGTTTLALSLVGMQSKDLLYTYTAVNRQRVYGADVITRIAAAGNGKLTELTECIRKDLLIGIKDIIEKTGIDKDRIVKIAIAGNTTMGHLLLGYSCKTLGVYPFTAVNIKTVELSFTEVFASDYLGIPVIMLPGISTFVGADIVAGLLQCDYDRTEGINLFLDLGTNGELAIGNKDRILVSSTAAGPAFEGGNILCGVGSIAGAICHFDLAEKPNYRTIGDKAPVGICGSGVIELMSELVKAGLVDETGLLKEEYFEEGYPVAKAFDGGDIVLTQHDIREIQLAKAAVRAGIEILLRRYQTGYEDIDTVYVAGGFGYHMNINKAVEIGLLPLKLKNKVKTIGNSSLQGTHKYLTEVKAPARMEHIIKISEEIHLSKEEDFNDLYIGYMNFV
jgi:uncharacterized 2Fe-2S/4Fe-4S cluster protein (DUF4445 family)